MKCSKCGYERQSRDDAFVPLSECPACGVIYTKHDSTREPTNAAAVVPPPHLKPSPVDATSLLKARERVDKRLRERFGTRVRDHRHAQTLELAKRLTAEQIRKRRDEWQQAHPDKPSPPPPPEKSAQNEHTQGAQAFNPDMAPPSQGKRPKENQTIDSAQAAAEKLTPAEARPPEALDPPMPPVEKSPAPAGQAEMPAAEASHTDEKAVLLDDVVMVPGAEPGAAQQAQTPQALGAAQQVAENALPASEDRTIPGARIAVSASQHRHESGLGGGLTRLLPLVAWLILGAGVIGAVLSWITIGDVEAGVRIPIPESMSALPLGLLLGFAYLATGVLGFAFFWVSSLISIQLRDIRRLLMYEERSSGRTQKAEIEQ